MQLIDTHSHFYASRFQTDLSAVIQRAKGVLSHVFLPNIDLESVQPMLELAAGNPEFFYPMMGLHPCYVKADYKSVLAQIETHWEQGTYFGVGETGLDFHWDKTFVEEQKESLRLHCRWAREKGLPLILHGRAAMSELIQLISEEQDGRLRGIFHCFGGSAEEARQIKDLGFLMGIGGVITYKKSGLATVVKEIDLADLVLETDAPYLSPVPHRGKRNESSYVPIIARQLAEAKGLPLGEVARVTSENALKLFALNGVTST